MNQTKSMLAQRIFGGGASLILLLAFVLPRTSYSESALVPITVPAGINLTNCARVMVDDYMDFLQLTPTHPKKVCVSVLSYRSDPAKGVTNIRMGLLWDFRKGVSLAATGSMIIRKKSLSWIHDSANHKTEEFIEGANRKPNFEYWIPADAEKRIVRIIAAAEDFGPVFEAATTAGTHDVNGADIRLVYSKQKAPFNPDNIQTSGLQELVCKTKSPLHVSGDTFYKTILKPGELLLLEWIACDCRGYELILYHPSGTVLHSNNDPNSSWRTLQLGKSAGNSWTTKGAKVYIDFQRPNFRRAHSRGQVDYRFRIVPDREPIHPGLLPNSQ